MPVFPFRERPKTDYHHAPLAFGSPREGGQRKHAGVDLYFTVGTEILAVADGIVRYDPYYFYCATDAVEIQHEFGIIRYGEIDPRCSLKAGDLVREGQVIARVGHLKNIHVPSDMLHFELYSNPEGLKGNLTDIHRPPFQRRSDLQNPTEFLDSLALFSGSTGS